LAIIKLNALYLVATIIDAFKLFNSLYKMNWTS